MKTLALSNRSLLAASLAGVTVAVVACGSSSGSNAAALTDTNANKAGASGSGGSQATAGQTSSSGAGGTIDAGMDAPIDSPADSPVDSPMDAPVDSPIDSPMDAPDDADAAPPLPPVSRTLVDRSLYGTSTKNLVFDPFATNDVVFGHFYGFYPKGAPDGSSLPGKLVRVFESDAPNGVTAPIALLRDLAKSAGNATSFRVITRFLGGNGTFSASIFVSASTSSGDPAPYATNAKTIRALLISPDVTSEFDLVADPKGPTKIGDREWMRLVLAAPTALPKGGYFEIDVQTTSAWRLASPEIVPTNPAPPPPPSHSVSDDDRAAIREYERLVRDRLR